MKVSCLVPDKRHYLKKSYLALNTGTILNKVKTSAIFSFILFLFVVISVWLFKTHIRFSKWNPV